MSTDDGTTIGGTKNYIYIVNPELYIILLLMLAGSVGSVHGSFVASAGPLHGNSKDLLLWRRQRQQAKPVTEQNPDAAQLQRSITRDRG